MNTSAIVQEVQTNGETSETSHQVASNGLTGARYESLVAEQPLYTKRNLKVVCVGAGIGGLNLAYIIQHTGDYSFVDLTIYEKNADIGGTWYVNSYPGLRCDVPSHNYCFPWAPNPDWTNFYSSGSEIQDYLRKTTKKFNLDKHIQLNSKLVDATWDENVAQWRLKVDQQGMVKEDFADVLINGCGPLHQWKWPDIEGLHDFKGKSCHSANWNSEYDWSGNRVALIGNGASAIQILPQLQKTALKVVTYIRNPTYITPTFGGHMGDQDPANYGGNFVYTEERKKEFRENPEAFSAYMREMENLMNAAWNVAMVGHPLQGFIQNLCTQMMLAGCNGDTALAEKLTPKTYLPGCRRMTPGMEYLRALQQPNVTLHPHQIKRITSTSIEATDGSSEDVDFIVYATGFDTSFLPPWTSHGRGSHTLSQDWASHPKCFMGTFAPHYPNYFMTAGPGMPVTSGSFFRMLYIKAEYIAKWLSKIASEDIRTVVVKDDVLDEYDAYTEDFFRRTVFVGPCTSWYKSGKGAGARVTTVYAGSPLHYWEFLKTVRGEDFEIRYRSRNRWSMLGNGYTHVEEQNNADGGRRDLAPYWDEKVFTHGPWRHGLGT